MLISRERLEAQEVACLAPYGTQSGTSRGRVYPESEHPYRTRFQRDRDRIVHTTAFRRLEYKTQVFVNSEGDYYRTRLTHTLEVAQLGRTLARALGANEDLAEAVCLVHDIGHPPFGHAGEAALHRIMAEHGGFDHNKQTLRIVDKLEHRFAEFPGLNLTWEVRAGIVKHETDYDIASAESFEPAKRGSLEAQIANVADETAYTAHDLDDGLRAALLTPHDLAGQPLWERVCASVGWDLTQPFDELMRHRLIRRMLGLLVTDSVEATSARLDAAHVQSPADIEALPTTLCGPGETLRAEMRTLKQFLYTQMYRHHRLVRMTFKAEQILRALFNAYLHEPGLLPPPMRARLDEHDLHRVICDYIAGMTDRFALDEHDRLFSPHTHV